MRKSPEKNKKYLHRGQQEAMIVGANKEFIVANRGWGKSFGVDGPRLIRNTFAMIRSAGALLSPTYAKLLQNTLPAMFVALQELGYNRNVHYFVGRKPPVKLKWPKPYNDPISYDNVISWYNGSIQNLLSFDRPMSANSMSLDYILAPEAKFLNYDKIKNEVIPAIRGNRQYFGSCPWHHGHVFSTDMPTLKAGMWILDMEKEMDPELIGTIKALYREKRELITRRKSLSDTYFKNRLKYLDDNLNSFRSIATFFMQADPFDNYAVLGDKFFREQKRNLPPLIFQTAILNKRMKKVENGFYSSLNSKIHYYESSNKSYLDSLEYKFDPFKTKVDCRHDGDVNPDDPIIVSNDYNAAINNLVAAQVVERRHRTLKSFFVKTPRKLKDVVNDFCDYYHYHRNKTAVFAYDSTAIWDTPQDTVSFKDTVIEVLRKRGWRVVECYIGQPPKHALKHNWFDLAMKGDHRFLFPEFNLHNNEYLLVAMENTDIKIGRNGFEKNKDPEKQADSPNSPDELKTHVTDAWDTNYIAANFYYKSALRGTPSATHFGKK